MSSQGIQESYRRALIRENQAYHEMNRVRAQPRVERQARQNWGRISNEVEDLRRRLNENQQRAVHNQVIDLLHRGEADDHAQAVPSQLNVLNVNEAHDAPRMRRHQQRLIAENGGQQHVLNLRPFNPEHGQYQTRSVVITIKGNYEVIKGNTVTVSDINHVKEHVFEIKNFTSYRELQSGCNMALQRFLSMIEVNDMDSGYKSFVPMVFRANDSYSPQELAEFVRVPTTVRLHARMPVMYGFLKQRGVDLDAVKLTNDKIVKTGKYKNCMLSVILDHHKKHSIMVRRKWTAHEIAKIMVGDSLKDTNVHTRGYSIEESQTFFNHISKYNVYCFDQLGNLLWRSEYKKNNDKKNCGGKMDYPPLLFVAHDQHCYAITDPQKITSALQRVRAAGKTSTNLFESDQEKIREKATNAVVEALERKCYKFKWVPDTEINLSDLDSYENCNLFVDNRDLYPMLIQLFRQTNYVHTVTTGKGRITRIDYHNDVTIWANPNKSVVNLNLDLHGNSFMSKEVCKRLSVPWKNQSIGAATNEFCDAYFNPLSGKDGKRPPMPKKERERHLKRFGSICQVCKKAIEKKDDYHVDHVVRREVGGSEDDSNLVVLHQKCHDEKTRMECNVFRHDRTISHYNSNTIKIFSQAKNAMVHNFVHWSEYGNILTSKNKETGVSQKSFQVSKGKILAGLDIVKCRTYILRYRMHNERWADFLALDDVQPFDPDNEHHASIPPGEYEIHTTQMCPAKGNEWCSQVKVKYMLENKLLKLTNIKKVVIASAYRPGEYYEKFVQGLLDKMIKAKPNGKVWKQEWHVAKNCINQWVGTLGIRTSEFKSLAIYSSLEAAATDAFDRKEGNASTEKNMNLSIGQQVRVQPRVFDDTDKKHRDSKGRLKSHDYVDYYQQF